MSDSGYCVPDLDGAAPHQGGEPHCIEVSQPSSGSSPGEKPHCDGGGHKVQWAEQVRADKRPRSQAVTGGKRYRGQAAIDFLAVDQDQGRSGGSGSGCHDLSPTPRRSVKRSSSGAGFEDDDDPVCMRVVVCGA